MTTRGPVALACLCLLSVCFLAMNRTSSQCNPHATQGADGVPVEVEAGDSRSASFFDEPQNPAGRNAYPRQDITNAIMPPPNRPFPMNFGKKQPGRLPAQKTAQPIPLDSKQSAVLREAIKLELPNAKPGEIDILVRKWRGMDLAAVRFMLQMMRQSPLRDSASRLRPNVPLPIPIPNTPTVITPDKRLPFPAPAPVSPSVVAFRQARDVIVNNIANAKTPGFKRSRVIFGDLPSAEIPAFSAEKSSPSLLRIGMGVRVTAVQRDWSQGTLQTTGRELDFAIQGRGFFVLSHGRRTIYTRRGNFQRDATGRLVLPIGNESWRVQTVADKPPKGRHKLTLSLGAHSRPVAKPRPGKLSVPAIPGPLSLSGIVRVELEFEKKTRQHQPVTTLQLAAFKNRDGLRPLGDGLFAATEKSGPATVHRKPANIGVIKSGCLEASNVDLKHEQAELRDIVGQMKAMRLAEEALNDTPRRRPIVTKPGVRRMSGTVPEDEWFDKMIDGNKSREVERNLGFDDEKKASERAVPDQTYLLPAKSWPDLRIEKSTPELLLFDQRKALQEYHDQKTLFEFESFLKQLNAPRQTTDSPNLDLFEFLRLPGDWESLPLHYELEFINIEKDQSRSEPVLQKDRWYVNILHSRKYREIELNLGMARPSRLPWAAECCLRTSINLPVPRKKLELACSMIYGVTLAWWHRKKANDIGSSVPRSHIREIRVICGSK